MLIYLWLIVLLKSTEREASIKRGLRPLNYLSGLGRTEEALNSDCMDKSIVNISMTFT